MLAVEKKAAKRPQRDEGRTEYLPTPTCSKKGSSADAIPIG